MRTAQSTDILWMKWSNIVIDHFYFLAYYEVISNFQDNRACFDNMRFDQLCFQIGSNAISNAGEDRDRTAQEQAIASSKQCMKGCR